MGNQLDQVTANALDDVCEALRASSFEGDFDHTELGVLVARARRVLYGVALTLASADMKARLCEAIAHRPPELPTTAALTHDRHVLSCLEAHARWLDEVAGASCDAARAHAHAAQLPVVWWPWPPELFSCAVGGAA